MNRRNAAFTIVELMIAMAIVTVVLYAAINFFIVSVRQYKVQTKITETNVEGIFVAGDGTGKSRGIVGAGISGILAANGIAGKYFNARSE